MCTAISLVSKNNHVLFGRNMDFSYELDPEVYIVPKGYEWTNVITNDKIKNSYRFMGTGQNIGGVTFADGMNEIGLGVASLYFTGYARYNDYHEVNNNTNKIPIASYDVIHYLLGNCSHLNDVIQTMKQIDIIGVEDAITRSVSPLHWFVSDRSGKSLTIESTDKGLQVIDNPINVLANSPDFEWQLTNLRNYLNVNPVGPIENTWNPILLTPFGQGSGSFGLPGDYTSPSRFIRTAFLKSFADVPDDSNKTVTFCFHLLKSVFIPKGIVITPRNTDDYTQYTVFMNLNTLNYYINTYDNNQILIADMNHNHSDEIISLGKIKQPILFQTF